MNSTATIKQTSLSMTSLPLSKQSSLGRTNKKRSWDFSVKTFSTPSLVSCICAAILVPGKHLVSILSFRKCKIVNVLGNSKILSCLCSMQWLTTTSKTSHSVSFKKWLRKRPVTKLKGFADRVSMRKNCLSALLKLFPSETTGLSHSRNGSMLSLNIT